VSAPEFSFPVPLVCPKCDAALLESRDAICSCGTRFELWNGIPRLLFGQRYWGECSSEQMAAILKRMDEVHWRQALKDVAGGEAVERHLSADIGTDFVFSMPDNIETALDIGSGMGFMTSLLARRAKTVVALEAVPQRALFQKKRAAQDGLGHWRPIIASALAMPFAAESFDLITLNGVFEYIGLWGEGNPQELQQQFLRMAFRLLKPNGYLYVGIETRYGLGGLLGGRDHSGLAYTSIMPRWLADWYCRRRRVHFYGSEHRADGYRTYTHTPAQYANMLKQAGFTTVDVLGAQDGYNRQQALYRLSDPGPRRLTRQLGYPPSTWKGWLRQKLADGPWYPWTENEVVAFARKSAPPVRETGTGSAARRACPRFSDRHPGPAWSGLHDGPVTQFSTGSKFFLLCFSNGQPASVFKGAKNAAAEVRLAREYDFLTAADRRQGAEAQAWPLCWPRPLGTRQFHGQTLYHYEYAHGTPLHRLLLPLQFRARRFHRSLRRLMESYVEWCAKMTSTCRGAHPDSSPLPGPAEFGIDRLDNNLARRVEAACARLQREAWPLQVTHGDLTLTNSIVLPGGKVVLVDWEHATSSGLCAVDLLRLLYDTANDAARLLPHAYPAILAQAKQTTRDVLARIGVGPDDYADLEALFVAHQLHYGRSPNADVPDPTELRQAYERGTFSLT
jgi:SAM-dependent methyltransferase